MKKYFSVAAIMFFILPLALAENDLSNLPLEERPSQTELEISKKKMAKTKKNKKGTKTPPKPPEPPKAVLEPPVKSSDAVEILYPDEIGKQVSHMVVGLANRLDSFFGEERSDDEQNGSTLRMIPSYTYYDGRKPVFEMGMNLNLKLRNLETKAKHLENSIREEILETTGTKEALSKPANAPQAKEEEENWHYNFESKLAARPAIYYSGKLRVRRNFTGTFFLHHFSLSGGWDTDDYWSQKIGVQSDHALNESILFRFNNESNWYITKKSFQTNHGPALIQTLNKYNSISYGLRLLFGVESNQFEHLDTTYSINYRHGTPSKRIFVDLIPAYSYPRSESYKEVRSFEIRLEYFFGDVPAT